ncbi:C-C chemokine receptor type 3-like [Protopterus annectens]|uniref:C-C chemokine receptor type 3-like n=1 Tax=Protopterus annectens TaxID=7888 RepID=UPI001CFAA809|nr:C-C chemokine receptor type 3-like [Protopterus annectens]
MLLTTMTTKSFLENATSDSAYLYKDFDEEYVILCDTSAITKFGASFVPVFYYFVFLFSLAGNGLIFFILLKYEKLKSATNILILNLVISDLLFAITLPFWAVYHSSEWIFGNDMCKIVSSLYQVGFYSSILFLTMMTIDRYLAIVHAMLAVHAKRLIYAAWGSVLVWVVSILSSVPKFTLFGTRDDDKLGILCEETGYTDRTLYIWKVFGNFQQTLLFFVCPLAITVYCYLRISIIIIKTKMLEKYKTIKLIFIIVLTFFICWAPYNILVFLMTLQTFQKRSDNSCDNTLDYAFYVCHYIAYFHCCINPILYTLVGNKFRRHLMHVFENLFCCQGNYRKGSITNDKAYDDSLNICLE